MKIIFWNLKLIDNHFLFGVSNLGSINPNLVSTPEKEATASLSPPTWSGCREISGFLGVNSVLVILNKKNIKSWLKYLLNQQYT